MEKRGLRPMKRHSPRLRGMLHPQTELSRLPDHQQGRLSVHGSWNLSKERRRRRFD